MKKIAAFLLALSLIFTAAGCSSSPAASGSSGAAAPKEKTDLVFADVGWDSIKFHNAVAGLIADTPGPKPPPPPRSATRP